MARSRSRSFITTEKPTTYDEDQFALPNLNSNWVYYKGKKKNYNELSSILRLKYRLILIAIYFYKLANPTYLFRLNYLLISYHLGAWLVHIILIICVKVLLSSVPRVSSETSWTLTNLSYMLVNIILLR